MTKVDILSLVLLGVMVLFYFVSRGATRCSSNPFDLGEAFIDATGKTSMGRVALFVALVVSSWGFIVLVVTERLTEWFFVAYLGAFVLNGVGSKLADKGKQDDTKPD